MKIRSATLDDCATILGFIRDLATYEKLLHEVIADEAALRATLFGPRPAAEVLIAEDPERYAAASLIEEHGDRRVRMGYLAFVGSTHVNGVSALHTELMRHPSCSHDPPLLDLSVCRQRRVAAPLRPASTVAPRRGPSL